MKKMSNAEVISLVSKVLFGRLVFLSINAILMFLCSGTFKWFNAWLYLSVFLVVMISFIIAHAKTNPETLLQDLQNKGSDITEDRILIRAYTILLFLFPIVIGFLERFQLSILPAWSIYIGLLIIGFSTFISLKAIMENKYFETDIRIHGESDHQVVQSGPYRFVRHPGYISSILMWLATPLLFQNGYLFVFSVVCCMFFIIRTYIEDKSLIRNLKGYQTYANKVRFRLLPGIW